MLGEARGFDFGEPGILGDDLVLEKTGRGAFPHMCQPLVSFLALKCAKTDDD